MTDPNKAAVLAKWPDAEAYIDLGGYCVIYPDKNVAHAEISQPFKEESEAWADAAMKTSPQSWHGSFARIFLISQLAHIMMG